MTWTPPCGPTPTRWCGPPSCTCGSPPRCRRRPGPTSPPTTRPGWTGSTPSSARSWATGRRDRRPRRLGPPAAQGGEFQRHPPARGRDHNPGRGLPALSGEALVPALTGGPSRATPDPSTTTTASQSTRRPRWIPPHPPTRRPRCRLTVDRIRIRATIDAPPARVWDRLADIADHVSWMADAAAIRFTGDRRSGVGTTFECETRIGPLRTTDLMEVTEWRARRSHGRPPRRSRTGTGRFLLRRARRGRTMLTWDEDLRFLGGWAVPWARWWPPRCCRPCGRATCGAWRRWSPAAAPAPAGAA